jgi:serine protease Do
MLLERSFHVSPISGHSRSRQQEGAGTAMVAEMSGESYLQGINFWQGGFAMPIRSNLRGEFTRKTVTVFFLVALTVISFAATPSGAAQPLDLTTAIVQVAKQNIPAVVHIEVTERREVSNPMLPFENDPFFRYFFGGPRTPKKFRQEVKGLGTGMIIDQKGHILTNFHVAGGATKIEVVLSNGQKYEAKLVGGDPKTDLAVILIPAKEKLPFVKFGDSDKIEVGEWVIAIGAPRGLDQTVTQGIISAKHRTGITDPSSYQDFLQTDAAINPGNSGGPLVNLNGEVIGVNAAIVSESGGFEGIGFAIPSNIAVNISKTLMTKGKIERGWLGVGVEDVTYERAKSLGMSSPKGASVADVMKGSPADRAGLQKGDIIVVFDNKEVLDAGTLRNRVAMTAIGQSIKVTVLRNGKHLDATVIIGNLQDATKTLLASAEAKLGGRFQAIAPKVAEKLGLAANQGVAVTSVETNGPLDQVGFDKGDMIIEVNGQAISSLESFVELVSSIRPREQATLLAVDHATGNQGYVRVRVR